MITLGERRAIVGGADAAEVHKTSLLDQRRHIGRPGDEKAGFEPAHDAVDAAAVKEGEAAGELHLDGDGARGGEAFGARGIVGEHDTLLVAILLQKSGDPFRLLLDAAIRRATHEVKDFQQNLKISFQHFAYAAREAKTSREQPQRRACNLPDTET